MYIDFNNKLIQEFIYKSPRPSWDEYFMTMAKLVSLRSTCSSRHNGCVIVKDNRIIATGYNGSPSGEEHCIDKNTLTEAYCKRRDPKYSNENKHINCPAIHAEDNAVRIAKSLNIDLTNAKCYCTLMPCLNCIDVLSNSNISEVYYETGYKSTDVEYDKWLYDKFRSKFKICMQITLSETTIFKIMSMLTNETATRHFDSTRLVFPC